MKTIYFDCQMGAAGDMIVGALLDLIDNKTEFIDELNEIFAKSEKTKNIKASYRIISKCGIDGIKFNVLINGESEGEGNHEHEKHNHEHEQHNHEHSHSNHHHHSHTSMGDISCIINSFDISDKVKSDIVSVYNLIAEAESKAHGKPIEQIHFHEVGELDAICDISAACLLFNIIEADKIYASPINLGSGTVKCAHGILPVPAPATAHILRTVPSYQGKVKSELCTPTGAAILKHFVSEFKDMPILRVSKIGYGNGAKDFEQANMIRVFYEELNSEHKNNQSNLRKKLENKENESSISDEVYKLSFNVDDMSGEETAFASEIIMEAGSLDFFIQPCIMKKSRPGNIINVLCKSENKNDMIRLIFKHFTTLGIREEKVKRHILSRKIKQVDSKYGKISRKDSVGYGTSKSKYEFDELSKIAKRENKSIRELLSEL